jgi:hypothetical protein
MSDEGDFFIGISLFGVGLVGLVGFSTLCMYHVMKDSNFEREKEYNGKKVYSQIRRSLDRPSQYFLQISVNEKRQPKKVYVDIEPFGSLDFMELIDSKGNRIDCMGEYSFKDNKISCSNGIDERVREDYVNLYNALNLPK